MHSSIKYPYLPHRRTPPNSLEIPIKLHTFSLNFLVFKKPSTLQEFPIPSVGGVWIFAVTTQYRYLQNNAKKKQTIHLCINRVFKTRRRPPEFRWLPDYMLPVTLDMAISLFQTSSTLPLTCHSHLLTLTPASKNFEAIALKLKEQCIFSISVQPE